jgi:hypothetical protein
MDKLGDGVPGSKHDAYEARDAAVGNITSTSLGSASTWLRMMNTAPAIWSTYLHGHALFRSESGLSPAESAVVFLAIAEANGVEILAEALDASARETSHISAQALQEICCRKPISDERLASLFLFALEMAKTDGQPSQLALDVYFSAGFSER